MAVYFTNERYEQMAMDLAANRPGSRISVNMAFFRLVKGASEGTLENLIRRVQREYPMAGGREIYEYIQDPRGSALAGTVSGANVLACAYELLQQNTPLGNETVPGRRTNTSDWIGHCLWEAKACGMLAEAVGLDRAEAMKLGMLHDIGRSVTHTFDHIVRGFEMLADEGLGAEALGCLTHSFVNGGRCASNEQAEPGFYVNDEGLPCWEEGCEKDPVTRFLEVCVYTPYDRILNLADLMATSRGIVSPMERLADIASRRTLDPVNRGYFLAELTNLCRWWLDSAAQGTCLPYPSAAPVRFTAGSTIPDIESTLNSILGTCTKQEFHFGTRPRTGILEEA